ncbi:hypothetical protein B0H14DRAFT_3008142 [Mycena olivaceomarginata]|nr:hypothetical protein B0H14DRAFT_3008142 [Mycena olivaceomarginata]
MKDHQGVWWQEGPHHHSQLVLPQSNLGQGCPPQYPSAPIPFDNTTCRLRTPAKYRRQSALVYFDAPLQSFSTHHSCSTNNRSIVLSPSSSQATKSASEFPSVIAEITVSAKHVAANFCQNVHSLSGGPVDRSQSAYIVSSNVTLSNTLVCRNRTRRPGSKVARSTISLNA